MGLNLEIGQKIKTKRIALNLSQQELAYKLGMYKVNISNIENGKRNLTVTTLNRIAKALDSNLLIDIV